MTDPRPLTAPAFKRLSEGEARHALYIDFEGEKDKAPVLLGILRRRGRGADPGVQQLVVDPEFDAAGPESRGLREAIEIVVLRAEHGDRRIVSWSEHDLEVVRTLCADAPELVVRFERRYANALGVAKRWASRFHYEDKPVDGQLGGYLAMIDYQVPADGGPGQVGETIRAMRPTLRAGRLLSFRQTQRWGRLLLHNRHDCAGMRAVCLLACRELEITE